MAAPIVIYKPRLIFEKYDPALGTLDGVDVEVTDDVSSVAIDVETPTSTVTTFAGAFQTLKTPEPSATVAVVITDGLTARWAPLVGAKAQCRVYDRTDEGDYRAFDTIVPINPGSYGTTEPGEAREVELNLAVLSAVTEGTE
jgi:hypothetical protein